MQELREKIALQEIAMDDIATSLNEVRAENAGLRIALEDCRRAARGLTPGNAVAYIRGRTEAALSARVE